jgi:hypothetical protein
MKKKKIGKKKAIFKKETFSKIYEDLYNNKKFSDFTIKFENKQEEINLHKMVLSSTSTFFEELFQTEKEIKEMIIQKDEKHKALFKFMYTGCFDYTLDTDILTFLLLAHKVIQILLIKKYKLKNIGEYKIKSKMLLTKLIEYVNVDVENRKNDFELIVENIDLKMYEKKELKKLVTTHGWMKKSFALLNSLFVSKKNNKLILYS